MLRAILLIAAAAHVGVLAAANMPADYRLLYEQPCATAEAMKDFVFTDPGVWRIGRDTNGNPALELFGKSKYTPKHRSPFHIAVLAGQRYTDFILEAELLSTVKPYGHQDMCVFFGFQDTNKFYYAHLGFKRDNLAHQITIVNDAPRAPMPTEANDGVPWGQHTWHKVRLERNTADGTIKVYFDDFSKPVMTARDTTFSWGYIGFGTFDDMGMVRNIKVYAPSFETRKANFFQTVK